ncbi:MAG TPA: COX15/CtaA family protein, partial [Thermoanaerobaculia bacterium]|nr:COX15/CtaA family protein [Thermoanaerobaculia bacterium]
MTADSFPRGLAAAAKALCAATFLLVIAGGLVTSTGSGLSVPDWPTTYGQNMFTFPPSKWVGGIRFEHSHRLIAATVGMLTVAIAVWAWIARAPRPVRILSAAAVGTVVLQGVLGGLTVRYLLPTPISVAHACLAQSFFALTVVLAMVTSIRWRTSETPLSFSPSARDGLLAGLLAFAAVFVQLVLGAWMRHSDAGLAIPDFPTAFGRVVPDRWDPRIAVHFAHRAWAAVVAIAVFSSAVVVRRGRRGAGPRRVALLLSLLLPVQMFLGALSIWSKKGVVFTVAHQTTGALILAGTVA